MLTQHNRSFVTRPHFCDYIELGVWSGDETRLHALFFTFAHTND